MRLSVLACAVTLCACGSPQSFAVHCTGTMKTDMMGQEREDPLDLKFVINETTGTISRWAFKDADGIAKFENFCKDKCDKEISPDRVYAKTAWNEMSDFGGSGSSITNSMDLDRKTGQAVWRSEIHTGRSTATSEAKLDCVKVDVPVMPSGKI